MPIRRYQGAYVHVWNKGLFKAVPDEGKWVTHVDVGSMYPTMMIVLNLSSENVRLLSVKPYMGKFEFDAENGVVEIPDTYRGQVRLQIGKLDSVTRRFMLRFRDLRAEYKKLGGKLGESKQRGVKLIMNMTYGYHGLEFSRYGSFLVAIATAGSGRFIMHNIIKLCEQYDDIILIECDTDGLYYFGRDISGEINNMLQNELFKDYEYGKILGVGTNLYDGMISYSMKNYILRKGDKNKFKGSSFHGRHMPRICQTVLTRFTDAVFAGEKFSAVWKEFQNLRAFPLREFTMSVQLGMLPESYDPDTMYADLSKQLDEPIWGQDIYYVKTVNGYRALGTLSDSVIRRTLDVKYYKGRIQGIVNRLRDSVYGMRETQVRKGGRKMKADRIKLHEWM